MFSKGNTVLLVVDMQERLLPHIHEHELLLGKTTALIECCKTLDIPIMVTEQYPEGIGPTIPPVAQALGNCPKISKRTFSCCREPKFMEALKVFDRKQVVLAGIETHVCIFQTAADLIHEGYAVQVISDAVGSRTPANKAIGMERMKTLGADLSSLESAVFELLETSACPEFKQVLRYLK